jgi:hypothetical protein
MITKEKPIKINPIKAPADFNDLLDLQDLKTQMSVLEHLQNNLKKYQLDFVKSFIKTSQEVIDCIPPENLGDYEIFDYDFSNVDSVKEFLKSGKNWVVNHRDKRMMEITEPEELKFKMNDNILLASDKRVLRINKQAYYRIVYFNELRRDVRMSFRFDTNELIDCSDYSYVSEGKTEKW